jgi:hypothetical protein
MSTDIAQERLTGRLQDLFASDPRFAAARPDAGVSGASEWPGLRLPQLVGSRPSGRLCAQWPHWSPAGSNRRRCSTQ